MYIGPNVFGDKQTNSNDSKVTAYFLILIYVLYFGKSREKDN